MLGPVQVTGHVDSGDRVHGDGAGEYLLLPSGADAGEGVQGASRTAETPEAQVLEAIRSRDASFDVSEEMLAELRLAGVSEAIPIQGRVPG
jgi:hypothetical protein